MPMTLIEIIDGHHGRLLRALGDVEALLMTPGSHRDLAGPIEALRRELLAHDLTAERFVVGPLRRQHVLNLGELAALAAELDRLSGDAVGLEVGTPDHSVVAEFVRRVRDHIERKARAVVPAARSAAAEGRLPAVPRWYVEEVYGQQGDPGSRPPEEWLG